MAQEQIVFLHAKRLVPEEVIELAQRQLPPGFALQLLEQGASPDERLEKLAGADFWLGYPGDPSAGELAAAKRLKLFQILSAGYEWLDLAGFSRAGVPVANNGGANAPTVAEHALLLILAVYKKLPLHDRELRAGRWLGARETLSMREFRGKRLGIVGFGRIGRELARLSRGFGVSVCYFDPRPAPAEVERDTGATRVDLDTLLRESDVVSVHAPLTPETHSLIDTRAFGLMRPSAILINTSRGPVVDEVALTTALLERRLAGAGLDVFAVEPLVGDYSLTSLDNVVLTPHVAGVSLDTWSRRLEFGFANIRRVAAGQPPESTVVPGRDDA